MRWFALKAAACKVHSAALGKYTLWKNEISTGEGMGEGEEWPGRAWGRTPEGKAPNSPGFLGAAHGCALL